MAEIKHAFYLEHSMQGSWVQQARSQTIQYTYPENMDLYHFCENLALLAPDDLAISPASDAVFQGEAGGPFAPSFVTYSLSNTGGQDLSWNVTYSAPWLTITPSGGSLAPGALADVTVELTANAAGLPDGIYTDSFVFQNLGSGITQTRGSLLRVGIPDYFTELFEVGDNDLSGWGR